MGCLSLSRARVHSAEVCGKLLPDDGYDFWPKHVGVYRIIVR
jgi:hypothetical protein